MRGLTLTLVDDETMRWISFDEERRTAGKPGAVEPGVHGSAAH